VPAGANRTGDSLLWTLLFVFPKVAEFSGLLLASFLVFQKKKKRSQAFLLS
jgi:hypothetical protein